MDLPLPFELVDQYLSVGRPGSAGRRLCGSGSEFPGTGNSLNELMRTLQGNVEKHEKHHVNPND